MSPFALKFFYKTDAKVYISLEVSKNYVLLFLELDQGDTPKDAAGVKVEMVLIFIQIT